MLGVRYKVFVGVLLGVASSLVQADQADIQRRYAQYAAVQQAVYQLAGEALDADADGTLEAAAWVVGAGVSGGGVIPPASGAPKHDGFGGALGYCVWDNGTVTASANRLAGSGLPAAPAIAVISYGLDNLFQTSCADLAVGQVKGDDYAFWLTNNQMHSAAANTVSMFWGAPVTDAAALAGLNTTALHEGEVRLVRSTNKFSRWNSGSGAWEEISSSESNWVNSGTDASYIPGKVAIGQGAVGTEQLVVNGGASSTVLGLKGSTGLTGLGIYNQTGSAVTGFFGINSTTGQLVLNSATAAGLAIQSNGVEVARFAGDGSLLINGVTVIDSARNITATAGTFSGALSANSVGINGVTVIDSARNITAAAGTFSGSITTAGTLTAAAGSFAGSVTAASISAGTGSFTGNVTAASFNQVPIHKGINNQPNNLAIGVDALGNAALWGDHNVAVGAGSLQLNTGARNTAVGAYALNSNGGGTDNSAVGTFSLNNNDSGKENAAAGAWALWSNTSGNSNTAIGFSSLKAYNGSEATAVGHSALLLTTTGAYNTAVGYSALSSNVTGASNTAVGHQALQLNTGKENTAVGKGALATNAGAGSNTAIGYLALNLSTGGSNTAVGHVALQTNSTGTENTAMGRKALAANTTASYNTGVGSWALAANTGEANTAVGQGALQSNNTGTDNTSVGRKALSGPDTSYNTAVGSWALASAGAYSYNVAVGADALRNGSGALSSVAIGYGAMRDSVSPYFSVAVGTGALPVANTLANTAIGESALAAHQRNDGSIIGSNVAVGAYALVDSINVQDSTAVGKGSGPSTAYTTGVQDHNIFIGFQSGNGMTGASSSNNVVIGSYTAGFSGSNQIFLADGAGNLRAKNSSSGNWTLYGTTTATVTPPSDIRYKKNITGISNALGLITQLEGVRYDLRRDEFPEMQFSARRQMGFIAQQIEPLVPELVSTNEQGFKSVNYAQMTALLATGIKELNSVVQQHAAVVNRFAVSGDTLTIRASSVGVTSLKAGSVETDRLVTSGAFSMVDATGHTVFSMNQGQGRMASLLVEDSLAAKSLALSGAGIVQGTMTAAAFVPSGTDVPSKGIYAPTADAIGVAAQGALIAKFDQTSVTLNRELVMGATHVKVVDKEGYVYAAHTATESGSCAGREGAIARGVDGQLFICR